MLWSGHKGVVNNNSILHCAEYNNKIRGTELWLIDGAYNEWLSLQYRLVGPVKSPIMPTEAVLAIGANDPFYIFK